MIRRACVIAIFATVTFSMHGTAAQLPTPQSNDRPCAAPEHRQFDFWLGDWDSYDKSGVKQGQVLVKKVLGECAIQEWWDGTDGSIGSSFTIFDTTRALWNQTWVSNHGTLLPLEGYKEGASMVLIGMHRGSDGKLQLHRTTWTPVGPRQVHQLWDYSTDGGKSWTVNYEGFLKPAAVPFDMRSVYPDYPAR